jgi:hypothetical protein
VERASGRNGAVQWCKHEVGAIADAKLKGIKQQIGELAPALRWQMKQS